MRLFRVKKGVTQGLGGRYPHSASGGLPLGLWLLICNTRLTVLRLFISQLLSPEKRVHMTSTTRHEN